MRRGQRIDIKADAVPALAIDNRDHKRENALVIRANILDESSAKVGIFHNVMFNAGTNGVIFKNVLDSEIATD